MKTKQTKKKFKSLAKAAYGSLNLNIRKIEVGFAPNEEKSYTVVVISAYPPKCIKVRVSKALMTRLITANKIKNERARNLSCP